MSRVLAGAVEAVEVALVVDYQYGQVRSFAAKQKRIHR